MLQVNMLGGRARLGCVCEFLLAAAVVVSSAGEAQATRKAQQAWTIAQQVSSAPTLAGAESQPPRVFVPPEPTLGKGRAVFRVTLDPRAASEPVSGRLLVLLARDGANLPPDSSPLDAPFWDDAQPLFGVDVQNWKAGESIDVDDRADWFLEPPSGLTPGTYRVAARLEARRRDSKWRRQAGNIHSIVSSFTVSGWSPETPVVPTNVRLMLDQRVSEARVPTVAGIEWVEVKSHLLTSFRGEEVMLRAGVLLPEGYKPTRKYPAIYEVPGFGGNHLDAEQVKRGRAAATGRSPARRALDAEAFWIVLDPEGPNGHTLFADSANNGPVGRALTEELIPALESRYPLIARPEGRLLRGHSSGGWSVLWLLTNYPKVFGACWSTAPDPVDFRAFQNIDIYSESNFYAVGLGAGEAIDAQRSSLSDPRLHVSYQRGGRGIMTVLQETRQEDVVGPANTSAQQWDSWFAVFGPRGPRGPAGLFDDGTGLMNRQIAEQYRAFDISDRLTRDPGRFAGVLRERARIVVGDEDNFFLHRGVILLRNALDAARPVQAGDRGSIDVLPGLDHGSVLASPRVRAFADEMLVHVREAVK
jgi:Putative esterase